MTESTSPYGAAAAPRKKITPQRLREMRARGEKITMLTAYDATFAAVVGGAPGTDTVLVGDSLGMVCQGMDSTLGVTLEAMRYHTECVARGMARVHAPGMLIADMPFGSYQEGPEQAMRSAAVLMQAGAHMVKIEGGGWTAATVKFLVERSVPVCAHLGLTPQSVHALGGYRVQGRGDAEAALMKQHALELQDAGATLMVLEMVPAALSREITEALPDCHTIGIGAGSGTAGQVLVLHDMLGINLGKMARFVKDFMAEAGSIAGAVEAFNTQVKAGQYPVDAQHAW
jgi:3-methyl-2-oxobutanoate hydroxymethyltransferase